MHKSTKIFGAFAVAGIAAVSSSAFTASNTVGGDNYAGYGSAAVTGAITQGIEHTLNENSTKIDSTLLTFTTDLTAGHQVRAGFNGAHDDCVVTLNTAPDLDTATCTYVKLHPTDTATQFSVAVS